MFLRTETCESLPAKVTETTIDITLMHLIELPVRRNGVTLNKHNYADLKRMKPQKCRPARAIANCKRLMSEKGGLPGLTYIARIRLWRIFRTTKQMCQDRVRLRIALDCPSKLSNRFATGLRTHRRRMPNLSRRLPQQLR